MLINKKKRNVPTSLERSSSVIESMQSKSIFMPISSDKTNKQNNEGNTFISSLSASSVGKSSIDQDTLLDGEINIKSKRTQKNTLGNKNILLQAARREKRQKIVEQNPLSDIYNDEELFEILQKTTNCCSKSSRYGGCIRKAFSADLPKALSFIKSARLEKGKLQADQLDKFIQEKVRKSISGRKVNNKGDLQFEYNWSHNGIELCRDSFSTIFDTTKHVLNACSTAFKLTETNRVSSIQHKEWNDSHVHNFTYAETENIMKTNLGVDVVGKLLTRYLLNNLIILLFLV
jgi:hypothetical protein